MASEERFGFQWAKYSALDTNYELQFRRWVAPLTSADFQGKSVLDAGCGMGRNSYWALKWGAGKIVAFDYDRRTIEAAKRNLKDFYNAEVIFKSIYDIDWENEFDLALSIGVIDHLEKPREGIANLVRAIKPGGKLLIWVYSFEGNDWIIKFVNPVRKNITSRLPLPLLHFLSYFCSIPLWLACKVFRGPGKYLEQLSRFKFSHIHCIVFDQLTPRIANYWRRDEALSLLQNQGLTNIQIHRPENKTGWTVIGTK